MSTRHRFDPRDRVLIAVENWQCPLEFRAQILFIFRKYLFRLDQLLSFQCSAKNYSYCYRCGRIHTGLYEATRRIEMTQDRRCFASCQPSKTLMDIKSFVWVGVGVKITARPVNSIFAAQDDDARRPVSRHCVKRGGSALHVFQPLEKSGTIILVPSTSRRAKVPLIFQIRSEHSRI